jgi:hypothetical protein
MGITANWVERQRELNDARDNNTIEWQEYLVAHRAYTAALDYYLSAKTPEAYEAYTLAHEAKIAARAKISQNNLNG